MAKEKYHLNKKPHNLTKKCSFPGCKRLGSPGTCRTCKKPHRRKWCPKHRKSKFKAKRVINKLK